MHNYLTKWLNVLLFWPSYHSILNQMVNCYYCLLFNQLSIKGLTPPPRPLNLGGGTLECWGVGAAMSLTRQIFIVNYYYKGSLFAISFLYQKERSL